ncbi:VOC family protein [Paenibacillus sacheonensis]|uniref:VOC family protein n=1 Tax=Paenibacillus sacheonensis TaxID=742054 RepID=A0A7X4YKE0_9BACL|nr:VOC family protein [Paenibacillus sacheonensis]MBM7563443.1 PhnB protein [Paenibacillus sacheonensis]NBC68002.1 VOC family protein [Paenibacillus sacheonensis]
MSVDAYLNFNGNCREVVDYYADVFETDKPKFQTFGDMPAHPDYPLPEEAKSMIMHARLTISGSNVMFSDVFPGMPFTVGNNISLAVVTDDREEIERAFNRLREGGSVAMELQQTPWSALYGQVTDRFGILWQFNLGIGEM